MNRVAYLLPIYCISSWKYRGHLKRFSVPHLTAVGVVLKPEAHKKEDVEGEKLREARGVRHQKLVAKIAPEALILILILTTCQKLELVFNNVGSL